MCITVKGNYEIIDNEYEALALLKQDSDYEELAEYLLACFKDNEHQKEYEKADLQAYHDEAEALKEEADHALSDIQDILDRLAKEDKSKRNYKAKLQDAIDEIQHTVYCYR